MLLTSLTTNKMSNKTTNEAPDKRKRDAAVLPRQKRVRKTAQQAQQNTRVSKAVHWQMKAGAFVKASILRCQEKRKPRSERRRAQLTCKEVTGKSGMVIAPRTVQDCVSKGKTGWAPRRAGPNPTALLVEMFCAPLTGFETHVQCNQATSVSENPHTMT